MGFLSTCDTNCIVSGIKMFVGFRYVDSKKLCGCSDRSPNDRRREGGGEKFLKEGRLYRMSNTGGDYCLTVLPVIAGRFTKSFVFYVAFQTA